MKKHILWLYTIVICLLIIYWTILFRLYTSFPFLIGALLIMLLTTLFTKFQYQIYFKLNSVLKYTVSLPILLIHAIFNLLIAISYRYLWLDAYVSIIGTLVLIALIPIEIVIYQKYEKTLN